MRDRGPALRDRQRLRGRLAGQPLQAQRQLGVDGQRLAVEDDGPPGQQPLHRLRQRHRAAQHGTVQRLSPLSRAGPGARGRRGRGVVPVVPAVAVTRATYRTGATTSGTRPATKTWRPPAEQLRADGELELGLGAVAAQHRDADRAVQQRRPAVGQVQREAGQVGLPVARRDDLDAAGDRPARRLGRSRAAASAGALTAMIRLVSSAATRASGGAATTAVDLPPDRGARERGERSGSVHAVAPPPTALPRDLGADPAPEGPDLGLGRRGEQGAGVGSASAASRVSSSTRKLRQRRRRHRQHLARAGDVRLDCGRHQLVRRPRRARGRAGASNSSAIASLAAACAISSSRPPASSSRSSSPRLTQEVLAQQRLGVLVPGHVQQQRDVEQLDVDGPVGVQAADRGPRRPAGRSSGPAPSPLGARPSSNQTVLPSRARLGAPAVDHALQQPQPASGAGQVDVVAQRRQLRAAVAHLHPQARRRRRAACTLDRRTGVHQRVRDDLADQQLGGVAPGRRGRHAASSSRTRRRAVTDARRVRGAGVPTHPRGRVRHTLVLYPIGLRQLDTVTSRRSPGGATLVGMSPESVPSPVVAQPEDDHAAGQRRSTWSRRTSPTTRQLAAVEKYDDRFLDRELSWLHFNQRVLELAEDPELPLLERVRFLAIFTSNLDEFFMVRVAGLKRRIAAGVAVRAASGLLPREVLEQIWTRHAGELMQRHARVFRDRDRAGAARRRHRAGAVGRPRPRGAEVLQAALQGPGLPGADAAGRRPGAPVPLHLRALAQPRGAGAQPQDRQGALRPGQGAADLRPLRAAGQPALRAAGGRHPRAPASGSSPGMEVARGAHASGSPATRTSRSRRTTPRTSSPRWRRSCCGAASARRCGSRSRSRSPRTVLELLVSELGITDRRGVPAARPAGPARAARHRRPAPARS